MSVNCTQNLRYLRWQLFKKVLVSLVFIKGGNRVFCVEDWHSWYREYTVYLISIDLSLARSISSYRTAQRAHKEVWKCTISINRNCIQLYTKDHNCLRCVTKGRSLNPDATDIFCSLFFVWVYKCRLTLCKASPPWRNLELFMAVSSVSQSLSKFGPKSCYLLFKIIAAWYCHQSPWKPCSYV